jgi:hypothetical protein
MASFTDAIPQFNPYIQQLPVEAMVNVGMEKQQRYDQGIQRIQSQIDQVAGLSISRPQDREYLQSKLNELGSKLKTVAAADFSNYQLVNSVAGMAGSIAKDPTIIASMQSTAQRAALQERIKKDTEAGKYNPANTTLYNISDQEWYNDPNVGAKYTGYYKTPHDVWGKIKDIAEEVGIDSKEVDNLFERDSITGEVKRDKDDNPIFDEMLVQKTLKGKDPAKLLSAFQGALTPEDYEQLSIEGRYKYLNSTPEELREKIVTPLNEKIEFNNGKVELLKIALVDENNKAKKNPQLIESLGKQIEYFETENTNLKKSQENGLKSLASNPEGVKAMLFTNDYLSIMSRVLSSEEVSTKYSVHPLFEIAMDKKNFLLSERVAQENAYYKAQENKRAQETFELTKEEKLLDIEKKRRGLFGGSGPGTSGLPQGITELGTPAEILAGKNTEFSNTLSTYNELNKNIAIQSLKAANPKRAGETDAAYETRLAVKLKEIAKVVDPDSGSINVAVEKLAISQLEKWRTDPDNMPPTAKNLIGKQNDALKTLSVLETEMKSAREEADQIAISRGIDINAYNKVMKSVKPTSIKIQTGESITLSPEDQLDLVNLRPERFNTFGSLFQTDQQSKLSSQARMKLNAKYGAEKVNNIEKLLFPSADFNSVFGGTLNSPILENISDGIRDSQVADYSEILAGVMQKSGMVAQPSVFDIPQGDLKEGEYNAKYSKVLENYRAIAPDEVSEISSIVLSGKFAGNAIAIPGNAGVPDRYYLNVTPSSGEPPTPIQINRQEFEELTLTQAPQSSSFTGPSSLLLRKGTTNMNSSGDYMSTYFSPSDFLNFQSSNYSLRGDLEKDLTDPNLSFMKLYLIDKNSGNLVDDAWVRDIPFDITLSNGSPNSNLNRASQGFNSQNVQLIFNRPVN